MLPIPPPRLRREPLLLASREATQRNSPQHKTGYACVAHPLALAVFAAETGEWPIVFSRLSDGAMWSTTLAVRCRNFAYMQHMQRGDGRHAVVRLFKCRRLSRPAYMLCVVCNGTVSYVVLSCPTQELESFYLPLVVASFDFDPHFDNVISNRARVLDHVRPLVM